MTNGHFDFEVEGVKYSLHFGNIAIEQFSRLSMEGFQSGVVGDVKSFTDMVFSGLYNAALIEGKNTPKYLHAAELVDLLIDNELDEIQEEIVNTYKNSRASVKQLERLNKNKEIKKKKPK